MYHADRTLPARTGECQRCENGKPTPVLHETENNTVIWFTRANAPAMTQKAFYGKTSED